MKSVMNPSTLAVVCERLSVLCALCPTAHRVIQTARDARGRFGLERQAPTIDLVADHCGRTEFYDLHSPSLQA